MWEGRMLGALQGIRSFWSWSCYSSPSNFQEAVHNLPNKWPALWLAWRITLLPMCVAPLWSLVFWRSNLFPSECHSLLLLQVTPCPSGILSWFRSCFVFLSSDRPFRCLLRNPLLNFPMHRSKERSWEFLRTNSILSSPLSTVYRDLCYIYFDVYLPFLPLFRGHESVLYRTRFICGIYSLSTQELIHSPKNWRRWN